MSEAPQLTPDTLKSMSYDDITEYFAGSDIPLEDISLEDLPASVLDTLDQDTQRGREGRPFHALFDTISSVKYPDGVTTYFASYSRSLNNIKDEEVVKAIDANSTGTVIGTGTIIYYSITNTSIAPIAKPRMVGFPFVGTTDTLADYRHQGLGLRRLFAMDYVSKRIFGMSLHSGLQPTPEAKSLWDNLVQKGKAVPPSDTNHQRYQFI